jgi:hypothetical protein
VEVPISCILDPVDPPAGAMGRCVGY